MFISLSFTKMAQAGW